MMNPYAPHEGGALDGGGPTGFAGGGSPPRAGGGAAAAAAGADETDSPLFRSDDFRIWCMKVIPCTKRFVHDWTVCPFAHAGEKAVRRDPRAHGYTGIACPDMKRAGACLRAERCPYAHNVFEYWLHPTRYRTQLCNDGPTCCRAICFFAHSLDELRVPACKPYVSPEALARASLEAIHQNPHPLGEQLPNPMARPGAGGGGGGGGRAPPAAAAAQDAALAALNGPTRLSAGAAARRPWREPGGALLADAPPFVPGAGRGAAAGDGQQQLGVGPPPQQFHPNPFAYAPPPFVPAAPQGGYAAPSLESPRRGGGAGGGAAAAPGAGRVSYGEYAPLYGSMPRWSDNSTAAGGGALRWSDPSAAGGGRDSMDAGTPVARGARMSWDSRGASSARPSADHAPPGSSFDDRGGGMPPVREHAPVRWGAASRSSSAGSLAAAGGEGGGGAPAGGDDASHHSRGSAASADGSAHAGDGSLAHALASLKIALTQRHVAAAAGSNHDIVISTLHAILKDAKAQHEGAGGARAGAPASPPPSLAAAASSSLGAGDGRPSGSTEEAADGVGGVGPEALDGAIAALLAASGLASAL